MTSTTLSSKGFSVSKKEFGVLFKWALKRNRSLIIVHSIILAVIGPVLNLYFASLDLDIVDEYGMVSLGIFVASAALFTLISAVKTFSFLHNKRSVDLYGAMPCNRVTLFLSHLLAGITSVAVPYIAAAALVMGISARSSEAIAFGLSTILFTVVMIAASYTFTALMAYCCGTVVDTLIVTFAVNIIWVAAVALFYGFLADMIPGAVFDAVISTPILVAFAPYAFGYMGIYAYFTDSALMYIGTLVWFIFYTALVFFAAAVLANRRKAESSQNGFAVKWLPMFIKAGASVIAGALFGYIFAATSDNGFGNMFTYCFWYIVIGAVAFFILHVIFSRGLKGKYLKSIVVYAATTAAALVLVFSMCFGMGVDTYVPNPNSVRSVTIDYSGMEYTDPETIRLATEIHKTITEGVRDAYEYPYYFGESNYDTEAVEDYTNGVYSDDEYADDYDPYSANDPQQSYPYLNHLYFRFKYKMNNGTTVNRDYGVSAYDDDYDREKLNDLCKQLMNTDEYKRKDNPYIFDEKEREKYGEVKTVSLSHYSLSDIYLYNYDANASLPTDEKFLNGLYLALQKDIAADKNYADSIDYFYKELGEEYLVLDIEAVALKKGEQMYAYDDTETWNVCSAVVKTSYSNTMKYISDYGIVLEDTYVYSDSYVDTYDDYIAYDFNDFIETGRYSSLYNVVQVCYTYWAESACEQLDVESYDWYDYEGELSDAVDAKSLELYSKMQKDHNANGEEHIYCPTYEEAQELLVSLEVYVYSFVAGKNGMTYDPINGNDSSSDTDTLSDTDKSGGTDSDKSTDTDKTASSESSKSSDNSSKAGDTGSAGNSSSTAEAKTELTSKIGVAV